LTRVAATQVATAGSRVAQSARNGAQPRSDSLLSSRRTSPATTLRTKSVSSALCFNAAANNSCELSSLSPSAINGQASAAIECRRKRIRRACRIAVAGAFFCNTLSIRTA